MQLNGERKRSSCGEERGTSNVEEKGAHTYEGGGGGGPAPGRRHHLLDHLQHLHARSQPRGAGGLGPATPGITRAPVLGSSHHE